MADFQVNDLAVYTVARGGTLPVEGVVTLRVGTVVRVLFCGAFRRGDTVDVGGSRRLILQAAQYIVTDPSQPELVAGVEGWQLVPLVNPDVAASEVRHGNKA